MRLTSKAVLLIKVGGYWIGFDEYGKYVRTDPYIKDELQRKITIEEAISRGRQLGDRLTYE